MHLCFNFKSTNRASHPTFSQYNTRMTDLVTKVTVIIDTKAKSTGIDTIKETVLRVRFTTPPAGDKLNRVVSQMLARYFNVPSEYIVLEHGEKLKRKIFLVIRK